MKYQRLSKEELLELEKEFVDFLVVNGITAQDWISLKENEPVNVEEIINQFSDVVWESILRSTKYLNKIEDKTAYYFKLGNENIELKKIVKGESATELYTAQKEYKSTRENEMFMMIKDGCTISDGADFERLF